MATDKAAGPKPAHEHQIERLTWVAGTLLLVMKGFNFLSRPELDLSLAAIVSAIFVIGAGFFTRET